MKAKILNVSKGLDGVRSAHGTHYVGGDYNVGTPLYEVKTDKGVFNLDRGEIQGLLAELGITAVYITANVLKGLVGSFIETTFIKDK